MSLGSIGGAIRSVATSALSAVKGAFGDLKAALGSSRGKASDHLSGTGSPSSKSLSSMEAKVGDRNQAGTSRTFAEALAGKAKGSNDEGLAAINYAVPF